MTDDTPAPTGPLPTEPPAIARPVTETRPRRRVLLPLLSVALVLSLGLAGALGWQVREDNRLDDARRAAVATAQTYAVNLTTYDHVQLDADFARVLDNSTGAFRAEYTAASESLRELISKFKATATGKVLSTAVVSVETDRVELLLFVDQTVNNTNAEQPRVDRTRMRMGLEKQDGRWLISSLDLV